MEEKVFDLLEKMYFDLNGKFDRLDGKFDELATEVKQNSKDIQKIQIKLENEIVPKLDILFDGQKQHTEILQRIEKEVARHEEVILKRIK